MQKLTIICVSCFFMAIQTLAQKNVKFGEVDKATLEMKIYDKDKNAPAVILHDYTKIRAVYRGAEHKKNVHQRIKILNKQGLGYATIEIPYEIAADEKVIQIKGYTFNLENGEIKRTKLEDEQIFDVKVTKSIGKVKITMPNVKEGSVIDLSYSVEARQDKYLGPWNFQSTIPTEWCELELLTPHNWDYAKIWVNQQKMYINQVLSESTADGMSIDRHRYVMKDIPAFDGEYEYIARPQDYQGHAFFLLSAIYNDFKAPRKYLPTWTELADALGDSGIGEMYVKNDLAKTKIIEMTKDKSDDEKISIVFDYVKNNFKYTDKKFSKTVKELLEKKELNVVEANYLLINHLRLAGLDAYPVVLSTRENKRVIKDYALSWQFNYMVVYVKTKEGKTLYLDPTNSYHTVGMIAERALSYDALLILPNGVYEWVYLRNVPKTSSLKTGMLSIEPKGTLTGKITTQLQGYRALKIRNKLKGVNDSLSIKENTESNIIDSLKLEVKNVDNITKPLEFSQELDSDKGVQVNGDVIYITPLLDEAKKENPFKQEKREFFIDFVYPQDNIHVYTFQIPEGYKVEEVPQSIKLQWADGKSLKFDYIVKQTETSIIISSKFIINRAVFAPEEYVDLKDFYAKVVTKQAEQIVLKKIK